MDLGYDVNGIGVLSCALKELLSHKSWNVSSGIDDFTMFMPHQM